MRIARDKRRRVYRSVDHPRSGVGRVIGEAVDEVIQARNSAARARFETGAELCVRAIGLLVRHGG